jgi:hypothetical protein
MIACFTLISPERLPAAVCLPQSSAAGVNNSGVTTGVGSQSGGSNVNIGDNTQPPAPEPAVSPVQTTAPSAGTPTTGGKGDKGGKTSQGTDSGYDPTRDPGMGSGTGGSEPPVDSNIGDTFQGQVPGRKPPSGDAQGGGQPIAQPPGYTSPSQPPGSQTEPTTLPPIYGPTGQCPPGYYPAHDGSCRPSRSLLPPSRPDGHSTGGGSKPGTKPGGSSTGGSSQPGPDGKCPPGCHLKPDGSGQCHCGGN